MQETPESMHAVFLDALHLMIHNEYKIDNSLIINALTLGSWPLHFSLKDSSERAIDAVMRQTEACLAAGGGELVGSGKG